MGSFPETYLDPTVLKKRRAYLSAGEKQDHPRGLLLKSPGKLFSPTKLYYVCSVCIQD